MTLDARTDSEEPIWISMIQCLRWASDEVFREVTELVECGASAEFFAAKSQILFKYFGNRQPPRYWGVILKPQRAAKEARMSFVRRPGAAGGEEGAMAVMAASKRQKLEDAAVGVFPYAALPREVTQLGVDALEGGSFGVVRCRGVVAIAYVRSDNHLYVWRLSKDRRASACMRLSLPPQIKTGAHERCFVSAFDAPTDDQADGSSTFHGLGLFLLTASGVVCCWPQIDARTVPVVETLPLTSGSHVCKVDGDGVYVAAGATRGDIFVVWLSPEDLCLHVKHCSESIPAAPVEQATGVTGFVNRLFGFGGGAASPAPASRASPEASQPSNSSEAASSVASDGGGLSDGEVSDLLIRVIDTANDKGAQTRVSVFTLYAGREAVTRWDLDPQSMQTSCAWTLGALAKILAPKMHVSQEAVRLHRLGVTADRLVLLAASPGRGATLHEFRGIDANPYLGSTSSLLSLPDSLDFGDVQFAHGASAVTGENGDARFIALLAYESYAESTPSLRLHALEFPSRRGNPDADLWAMDEKQDVTTGWFALAGPTDKVDGFVLTATCVLGVRLDSHAGGTATGASGSAASKASGVGASSQIPSGQAVKKRNSAATLRTAREELYSGPRKLTRSGRASTRGGTAGGFSDLESDAKPALKILKSAFNAYEQESALGRDGMVVAKNIPQFSKLVASTSDVLDYAVIGLVEHILDGKPNQRWADRQASDLNDSDQFSGRLILRHLVNKQARFGASGLIGFLERAGILEGLTHEAHVRLANLDRKLSVCKSLCTLQAECSRQQSATADGSRAHCVMQILHSCQRELVLARTKLSADTLDEQLEETGLSVADLFFSNVTDVESVIEYVATWLYSKEGDRDALSDVLAANSVVLTVFTRVPIDNETLAELAQPEGTMRAWSHGHMVMDSLRSLLEVTKSAATSNPDVFSIWQQYYELVFIYFSGQRRGEDSEGSRDPDATVDESNWKQLVDQNQANALIGAFGKQNPTADAFWQDRVGGEWWRYDLAREFACHTQLFEACQSLDAIPHEDFLARARYKNEKDPYGSFLKKALVESVSSHVTLRERAGGSLYDFTGVKGQVFRGVPALFAGEDDEVPGWRMDRWNVSADTIRWSFRADHAEGVMLSFDGEEFSLVQTDVPGDHELFQILPVSGGAMASSPRFAPRSTDAGQTYRVLSWDNVTYMGINEYGIAEPVRYAPQRDDFVPTVLDALFQPRAEDPSLILDIVEDGALDSPLLRFLQRQEGNLGQQASLVHQLRWLTSLRLGDYESASKSLHAHRDEAKRRGNNTMDSVLEDPGTLQSLAKLSQLAI
ncbi:Hypothetical Protein FCC1311_099392 [Hondaea fermentalgiana]|uniref:Nuclear pore complex protein Nup133 n=1 Tax=Hondaea fermentalgiana TaxID=2315210 RepID=A0A2R5GS53_9STRA|nr:Hypothetical Protein FCC1311_099392 [Hondaea fermentalgiana]|eukprot:GBG33716.1 Hypothetical Protein FCC1311_099392 [Hondaea fermentalgiana]